MLLVMVLKIIPRKMVELLARLSFAFVCFFSFLFSFSSFFLDLDNLSFSKFVLPVQGKSDFILSTATIQSLALGSLSCGQVPRALLEIWLLLFSFSFSRQHVKINLATYHSYIDESPVDLTYMNICCCHSWQPIRLCVYHVRLFSSAFGFWYCGGTRTALTFT